MNNEDTILVPQSAHATCLILVDTSGSMGGERIKSVNDGLRQFYQQLLADEQAKDIIDVAVVSFNDSVEVIQEFMPVSLVTEIPELTATGLTAMGKGLETAIEMVLERKRIYDMEGIESFIPWIVMFTDGAPTDDISVAKQRLDAENAKSNSGRGRIQLWTLAVEGASIDTLQSLTPRNLWITGNDYSKIFDWTRKSLAVISQSKPGDRPVLPNLEGTGAQTNIPSDWA